jgi:sortase A
MALYYYIKVQPKIKKERKIWKFLPSTFLVGGIVFLANALLPILIYEIKSQNFSPPLISPVEVLGETTAVVDYSRPSNWFPTAPKLPPKPSKITHWTLSIPKLKIEKAVVEIGSEDLMKSLIQYPGTSLPGQYGNTVVFGHSVLPQFFNPKNYKTIFSTLPTLKEGDEILVEFDGVLYRYQVVKMVETTPDDVTVLEQRYDSEYLTLITCVPPGTYLRRLIVRAKLVRY